MNLKALADAVLERNNTRNQHATEDKNTAQLGGVFTPPKVARVDPAIRTACRGLDITPEQFSMLCNREDLDLIRQGAFSPECLRAYAESFAEGILSRRIVFHREPQL